MKKILSFMFMFVFIFVCSSNAEQMDEQKISELRSSVCAANDQDGVVHLHELGFGGGYGWGNLKRGQDDYEVFPLFVHIGFDINPLFGIEDHPGTLQFALEPFGNIVNDPDGGVEAGLGLMLRYSYPVLDKVSLYGEAGAGPMYLSIDTIEQGNAGFNFLDQFGGGLQYFFADDKAFTLGYRWRHISNAGLGHDPNTGINTHSVMVGLSAFY